MKINKILLILLLGIISLSFCYAEDFSLTVFSIEDRIFMNESAILNLTIENNYNTITQFSLYTSDIEWGITTDPTLDKIVKIPAGEKRSIKILAEPVSFSNPGLFTLHLKVQALSTKEVKERTVLINVRGRETLIGKFLPAVRTNLDVNDKIDPREDTIVKVSVENQNSLNLSDVRVIIRSKLINQEHTTQLDPYEKKTLEFIAKLNPMQDPQQDLLQVFTYVHHNEKVYEFFPDEESFEVIEYGKISSKENLTKKFLKRERIYTIINEGNTKNEEIFKVKRSLLKSIFISTEPNAQKIKEDGQRYYAWDISLDKAEKTKINVTTNFRIHILIIILAIIAVILYYRLRSPIIIRKTVAILERKEGGVSRINVQLEVINRTKKNLQNLEIIEKLPNILIIEKEFKIGTLQPNKILRHDKKGTIVRWDVGDLSKFEERIMTYKATAKLSILGRFIMPVTLAKFNEEGKEGLKSTFSNKFVLKI